MQQPVARIGDPISHGGGIIEGSLDTRANGLLVARHGDQVSCSLHGLQTIVASSQTVLVNSKRIARKGDTTTCGATITQGSSNVFAGD